MKSQRSRLSELIDMESPEAVLAEVRTVSLLLRPAFDFTPVEKVFQDMVKLFSGHYPGYKSCNTEYHDLKHTTDTLLAMARLIHGAQISGLSFSGRMIRLGLISALLHDTGYIQACDDNEGTGAKYTVVHVKRSIAFTEKYFTGLGYARDEYIICKSLIQCSGLDTRTSTIPFGSSEIELMGKLLGTADLIGQMADRTYLEKLLFLYREFKEAQVLGSRSELDLLNKTLLFYEKARERLEVDLDNMHRNVRHHFRERWNRDRDLYHDAIEGNLRYLSHVLKNHEKDYLSRLKRGGIVKRIQQGTTAC